MPDRTAVTPRKQPKQARARATVEAILEATARVLVEEGYESATTGRIAEVAGVSIGSLYQYFPTKDALVLALLERHEAHMVGQLAAMAVELQGVPLEKAVRVYVRSMLAVHAANPKLHQVLTMQIGTVLDAKRIREMQSQVESLLRAYLDQHRERLRPTNLDHAAFLLVTAVEAVTHLALLDRPQVFEDESFAEEVSQLVLRYLLREPPAAG